MTYVTKENYMTSIDDNLYNVLMNNTIGMDFFVTDSQNSEQDNIGIYDLEFESLDSDISSFEGRTLQTTVSIDILGSNGRTLIENTQHIKNLLINSAEDLLAENMEIRGDIRIIPNTLIRDSNVYGTKNLIFTITSRL